MEKIIIYRAFDGEDFYNEQECLDYEAKYEGYIDEFCQCYSFYDKDNNEIIIKRGDLCETLTNIEDAFDFCETIKINNHISDDAYNFFYEEFGWDVPTEPGKYLYDFDDYKWGYYGRF